MEKIKTFNFQGTTKCPGLIHKEIWERVGGWSEEFSPTGGDDTDFAMKLWKIDVRIFKGLNDCKVYHFGSIVTRRYKKHPTIKTESGNKGSKIFLLKWGLSIKFFKRFYLNSDALYTGALSEPTKNIFYYYYLTLCKLNYLYLRIFYNFKNLYKSK